MVLEEQKCHLSTQFAPRASSSDVGGIGDLLPQFCLVLAPGGTVSHKGGERKEWEVKGDEL